MPRLYYLPALISTQPVQPVVVYGRVSTKDQYRDGNLDTQLCWVRRQAHHKYGLRIIGQFTEDYESTWGNLATRYRLAPYSARYTENLQGLRRAAKFALKHNAVILISHRNRILRCADLRLDRDAEPFDWQWGKLNRLLRGAIIASLMPPDATPKQVRAFETKISPIVGRPTLKSRRRKKLKTKAVELREQGWSIRRIEKYLKVPRSTVHIWVKRVPSKASRLGSEN